MVQIAEDVVVLPDGQGEAFRRFEGGCLFENLEKIESGTLDQCLCQLEGEGGAEFVRKRRHPVTEECKAEAFADGAVKLIT